VRYLISFNLIVARVLLNRCLAFSYFTPLEKVAGSERYQSFLRDGCSGHHLWSL